MKGIYLKFFCCIFVTFSCFCFCNTKNVKAENSEKNHFFLERNDDFEILESEETFLSKIILDFQEINISKPKYNISRLQLIKKAYINNLISLNDKIVLESDIIEFGLLEGGECSHELVNDLVTYYFSENAEQDIKQRINRLLSIENDNSYSTNQNYSNDIQTNHFRIYFDNTISEIDAREVGAYMEELRIEMISQGFREPLHQLFHSRYCIYLSANAGVTATTATLFVGTKAQTKIVYNGFNNATINGYKHYKHILAHEYFHAIISAYIWFLEDSWFDEACAAWNVWNVCEVMDNTFPNIFNSFIMEGYSLFREGSSASSIFPLTVQKEVGYEVVREFWEEASGLTFNSFDYEMLKDDILDVVLRRHDSSFDKIYEKSVAYIMDMENNFSDVVQDASYDFNENFLNGYVIYPTDALNETYTSFALNDIEECEADYYNIRNLSAINDGGLIQFRISYSGSGTSKGFVLIRMEYESGVLYEYYYPTDGEVNALIYIDSQMPLNMLTVVISNESSSILMYDFSYKAEIGKKVDLNLNSHVRIYEDKEMLVSNGFVDYIVHFSSNITCCVQTFGNCASVIKLSNMEGTLLENDIGGGKNNNAFINYSFESGETYKIRICFIMNSSGYFKLFIAPSLLENYSAIPSIFGNTYTGYVGNKKVGMVKYVSTRSGEYTFKLTANDDTYLYIIDPISPNICVPYIENNYGMPSVYNDDDEYSYLSEIKTNLIFGKEYLIVYCFYDPALYSGNITITIL